MIIRKANLDDVEAIVSLDQEVLQTNWHEKLYAESIVFKDTQSLVLDHEGRLIGFLIYRNIGGDFEIIQLALNKAYQRQGLASMMIDYMIQDAQSSHIEFIYLEVEMDNLPALNLYKKYGFEAIHQRKNYYGQEQDAIVMRKEMSNVFTSN